MHSKHFRDANCSAEYYLKYEMKLRACCKEDSLPNKTGPDLEVAQSRRLYLHQFTWHKMEPSIISLFSGERIVVQ